MRHVMGAACRGTEVVWDKVRAGQEDRDIFLRDLGCRDLDITLSAIYDLTRDVGRRLPRTHAVAGIKTATIGSAIHTTTTLLR